LKKGNYKQILDKPLKWPIVQLSKNKKEFVEIVSKNSINNILKKLNRKILREELETTIYREKLRIQRNPWRADPPDEEDFWKKTQSELIDLDLENKKSAEAKEKFILKK